MIVTKKMLANYYNCHRNTARKKYQIILDILQNGKSYFTLRELSQVEDIPENELKTKL